MILPGVSHVIGPVVERAGTCLGVSWAGCMHDSITHGNRENVLVSQNSARLHSGVLPTNGFPTMASQGIRESELLSIYLF